ncbi:hypothetical protein [Nocardia sp. AG03]|uniref:hypothetical protein n=1 Tax=Nocardia sp. AG03 TaxID=3025312 RepID=UPI0024185B50|nr:hypothetical protein [Nocardia sp. AG03]
MEWNRWHGGGWVLDGHPVGHRVAMAGYYQPRLNSRQYLVECECGWSTWAIVPNLGHLLGAYHARAAAL